MRGSRCIAIRDSEHGRMALVCAFYILSQGYPSQWKLCRTVENSEVGFCQTTRE